MLSIFLKLLIPVAITFWALKILGNFLSMFTKKSENPLINFLKEMLRHSVTTNENKKTDPTDQVLDICLKCGCVKQKNHTCQFKD